MLAALADTQALFWSVSCSKCMQSNRKGGEAGGEKASWEAAGWRGLRRKRACWEQRWGKSVADSQASHLSDRQASADSQEVQDDLRWLA